MFMRSYENEIAENLRLLRLIHEDDGWTLARVKRAAELEQEVVRLRDLLQRAYRICGPDGLAAEIEDALSLVPTFPPRGQ